jgi:hypothetical protein
MKVHVVSAKGGFQRHFLSMINSFRWPNELSRPKLLISQILHEKNLSKWRVAKLLIYMSFPSDIQPSLKYIFSYRIHHYLNNITLHKTSLYLAPAYVRPSTTPQLSMLLSVFKYETLRLLEIPDSLLLTHCFRLHIDKIICLAGWKIFILYSKNVFTGLCP